MSKKNQPVTIDNLTDKIKRHILANIADVEHIKVSKHHQSFVFPGFSLVQTKTHADKGEDFYLNDKPIAWLVGFELWGFIEDELLELSDDEASDKNTLEWLQIVVKGLGI